VSKWLKLLSQHVDLDKPERYAVFWNFVGNPLYRMLEKGIAEDCRSEKYRKRLFEKIDALINELRPDKELLRKGKKEERSRARNKRSRPDDSQGR